MNTLISTLRTALTLAVTLLLLAGGQTAVAQDHDHSGDAEAKECPMMAEGASMEDCPMKHAHDGEHHHHMHGNMEECPMMVDGVCPMKQERDADGHDHSASAEVPLHVTMVAAVDDVLVIEIAVGPRGYEPSEIELAAGETTRLVFTRTADGGCVGQVQIPDLGVEKTDLPLGEAVTIEVTPSEAGTFRFACGMNMVRGTILVRE